MSSYLETLLTIYRVPHDKYSLFLQRILKVERKLDYN